MVRGNGERALEDLGPAGEEFVYVEKSEAELRAREEEAAERLEAVRERKAEKEKATGKAPFALEAIRKQQAVAAGARFQDIKIEGLKKKAGEFKLAQDRQKKIEDLKKKLAQKLQQRENLVRRWHGAEKAVSAETRKTDIAYLELEIRELETQITKLEVEQTAVLGRPTFTAADAKELQGVRKEIRSRAWDPQEVDEPGPEIVSAKKAWIGLREKVAGPVARRREPVPTELAATLEGSLYPTKEKLGEEDAEEEDEVYGIYEGFQPNAPEVDIFSPQGSGQLQEGIGLMGALPESLGLEPTQFSAYQEPIAIPGGLSILGTLEDRHGSKGFRVQWGSENIDWFPEEEERNPFGFSFF
jgi:hypothetical protein